MNRIRLPGQDLVIGTATEVTQLGPPAVPFALLVASGPGSPTLEDGRLIEALAVPSCRAMCFSGPAAERLHDAADGIVEERGLFDVVTTWHADEGAAGVASYFLEIAGSGASLLLACVDHEPTLAKVLFVSAGEPR